ncbi:MAG: FAD-dependent monooxygenase [Lachnospiraceae bacterium]|nr:FAD-dependent monooxygenase [Lachnospiraceae bacterium]
MILVKSVKISAKKNIDLLKLVKEKYNVKGDIKSFSIVKKSIDARRSEDIKYIYSFSFETNEKEENILIKKFDNIEKYEVIPYCIPKLTDTDCKTIIVGMGPAGLFAALILVEAGIKPVIIERGKKCEERFKDVNDFWESGILNTESNVQFGEGGAGTFSDGKLNTGIKDREGRKDFVLDSFVRFGANENILYDSKPHIGTDVLRNVIGNIREYLLNKGATILYDTKFESFETKGDRIFRINVRNTASEDIKELECDNLILAIGHSARDTFEYLKNRIPMEPKSFAMGFRVIHSQEFINESQYGISYRDYYESLENSPYKLVYQGKERGVYTFCMCPGGYVVNASSEKNRLCVNGMSENKRDSGFANSAVICQINSKEFGDDDVLSGMNLQRSIEEKAYNIGNGKIPVSYLKDFFENLGYNGSVEITDEESDFSNAFKGLYVREDITGIYPDFINQNFSDAMCDFNSKIKGFASCNPLIAACETRSSSPVRILRNDEFESSVRGIYPCGEGAGYAGGIVSAAIDGMKVAEAIINKILND